MPCVVCHPSSVTCCDCVVMLSASTKGMRHSRDEQCTEMKEEHRAVQTNRPWNERHCSSRTDGMERVGGSDRIRWPFMAAQGCNNMPRIQLKCFAPQYIIAHKSVRLASNNCHARFLKARCQSTHIGAKSRHCSAAATSVVAGQRILQVPHRTLDATLGIACSISGTVLGIRHGAAGPVTGGGSAHVGLAGS